ncbi:MAG: hypothetical protein WC091_01240 [Sulfuricellaceae bacterium]
MRTPISISASGRRDNLNIVALCDDGSIWLGRYGVDCHDDPYPSNFRWEPMPPVPGSKKEPGG